MLGGVYIALHMPFDLYLLSWQGRILFGVRISAGGLVRFKIFNM